MRHPSACCTAALLVLLAGCGSDSDSPDDIDPSADPAPDAPSVGSPGTDSPDAGSPDVGSPTTEPSDTGSPLADPPDEADTGSADEDDGATSGAAPPADAVPGDTMPGEAPTITVDTYETILREIVAIADDRAVDEASASVDPLFRTVQGLVAEALETGTASGDGLVFVSDEARENENESERTVTFSCGDGGTLVVEASVYDDFDGSPFVSGFSAGDGCAIGGDLHAGRAFKRVRFVRGTDVETFEGFSIERADGDSLALDGDYRDTAPEGRAPGVETGWSDTDLVVVEGGETTRIESLDSMRTSDFFTGPGASPGADADASFSVTAPWSGGERLDVTVDLAFEWDGEGRADGGRIPGQQWESGTLRVVAADGSGLTLSPETGDPATFSVTIDGDAGEPIVREWADGFQLTCPVPYVCG